MLLFSGVLQDSEPRVALGRMLYIAIPIDLPPEPCRRFRPPGRLAYVVKDYSEGQNESYFWGPTGNAVDISAIGAGIRQRQHTATSHPRSDRVPIAIIRKYSKLASYLEETSESQRAARVNNNHMLYSSALPT